MITLLLFLLTFSLEAQSENAVKIAIIDSGLSFSDSRFKDVLCKSGHRDLTFEGISDFQSHGTHVAGLIKKYAGKNNYCFVIYKVYNKDGGLLKNEVLAIRLAIEEGVKFVNISGGGPEFSEEEYNMIRLHPEVEFNVAAGNDSQNLDSEEALYYPAKLFTLKNVRTIGNMLENGRVAPSSNWGSRLYWECGEDVISTCLNGTYCQMSGTSMSAAISTGKRVLRYIKSLKRGVVK